MRLNRWSYRDYAALPLLASVVGLVSLLHASPLKIEAWPASTLARIADWTLREHGVHRWLLHQVQPFRRRHEAHHAHPPN